MRLLTNTKWKPLLVGKSDVRNGKPLISPLTRSLPRTPQTFETSNGIRMITQPRFEDSMRSRVALNDFSTGFGFVFMQEPKGALMETKRGQVRTCPCLKNSSPSFESVPPGRQDYFEKLATG